MISGTHNGGARHLALLLFFCASLIACSPETEDDGGDTSTAQDTTVQQDTTTGEDSTGEDTAGEDTTAGDTSGDSAEDTAAGDTVADSAADSTEGDSAGDSTADSTSDTADQDAEGDTSVTPPAAPSLVIEDQTLASPYDTIAVRVAALPEDATEAGRLRVRHFGGADDGVEAGSLTLEVGQSYTDASLTLSDPVLTTQTFVADVLNASDEPYLGVDGQPLEQVFSVTGDNENPELIVNNQEVAADDLYGLVIDHVYVPERFNVGLYVAVYEDDGTGQPGRLRGKQRFLPGQHTDTAFAVTSRFIKGHTLHALLRTPTASGGWTSSGEVIRDLSGVVVTTQFETDGEAFRPVLEIDDQTLAQPDEILLKKVTVPLEFIGGGWVAIYADDNGQPGALIGNLYYTKGTRENRVLTLDVPQEGERTLHAALHPGQLWEDAKDQIMVGPGGYEMRVTFRVGADSLSYILAPPYTTNDPRHVVVQRAYSWDSPAWVVLARDDNGEPGTLIAQRRVMQKYAGNVHFTKTVGDFLEAGTAAEFLQGQEGTYRRSVRGDESLHVLLYKDDPADGQFTYTPGGTEDLPVLDASAQPVTARFDVSVRASVQNIQKDSSRYYFPCPLSQHYNNATSLPVDCRCHVNIETLDFPECKAVIADGLNMSFGEGPRVRTQNFGVWRSGFIEAETDELIALAVWKDNETVWPENGTTIDVGAVMAIDVETRERRIIGGRYNDPEQGIIDIGAGPVLSYPFEIQEGPDGNYYIASYGYVRIDASLTPTVDIIRMDPATGDREYVCRSNHLGYNLDGATNPYGHCGNGRTEKYGYYSVQIGRKAFGIDESGRFYLSYAHNGNTDTSDGIGVLQIAADGSTCDFVTRTKVGADNVLYQGQNIGSGPEPQAGPYHGMLVKDGKLYTSTRLTGDLYEVDIATGDRVALHVKGVDDNHSGSSGTHVVWDPHRELIWQAGFSSVALMYDPATDTSTPLWCAENYRDFKGINCMKAGAWGNNGLLLERGLWMHPTRADYIFVVNGPMIQRVDLAAGTSEIFSY